MCTYINTMEKKIKNNNNCYEEVYESKMPRKMSEILLNELNGNFFEDKFDLGFNIDNCVAFEYDLDELIKLSKQLQKDYAPPLTASKHLEQSRSCINEGVRRSVSAKHIQPHEHIDKKDTVINKPKMYVNNEKPKTPIRTTIKTGSNINLAEVRSCASESNLNIKKSPMLKSASRSGSAIKIQPFKGPVLELVRPTAKKHSCVKQQKLNVHKRTSDNGTQSARPYLNRFYNFETVHPGMELVQTKKVFPKRIYKMPTNCRQQSHSDPNVGGNTTFSTILEENLETQKTDTPDDDKINVTQSIDPTWHDVFDQSAKKHHQKEIPLDKITQTSPNKVEVLPDNIAVHQTQFNTFIKNPHCTIQVLPPLNIKGICQIQRLPDVNISVNNLNKESLTTKLNNQYLQMVYCDANIENNKKESTPDFTPKRKSDNPPPPAPEPIKEVPDLTNNPLQEKIKFANDDHDHFSSNLSEKDSSISINNSNISDEFVNSEYSSAHYSSNFEQASLQHQSSVAMTDDEKMSAAESIQNLPQAYTEENICSQNMNELENKWSDKQAYQLSYIKSVEKNNPENKLPENLMQIINEIFDSSSEDDLRSIKLPKTLNNANKSNSLQNNDPNRNNLISKADKVVCSVDKEISAKIDLKDIAMQTVDFTTVDLKNAFVQTDTYVNLQPEIIVDKYHIQDANSESIASTQQIFDRIRNEKVAFYRQQHDLLAHQMPLPTQTPPPSNNAVEMSMLYPPKSSQLSQPPNLMGYSLATMNLSQPQPRQCYCASPYRQQQISHLPPTHLNNSSSYPTNVSSNSNENVAYGHQFTSSHQYYQSNEIPQHNSTNTSTNKYRASQSFQKFSPRLSPSERLQNFRRLQHQELLRKHPEMIKTIRSIQNESANYSGRKLNTYRSYYEDDSIQKAAQSFLESIKKSNASKRPARNKMSTTSSDYCRLLFQTDSSNVLDTIQPTTTSDSSYFAVSPKWDDRMDSNLFCTNSEENSSSSISPKRNNIETPKQLNIFEQNLKKSEIETTDDKNKSDSSSSSDRACNLKEQSSDLINTLNHPTSMNSSIENSISEPNGIVNSSNVSLPNDDNCKVGPQQQISTSSSIENQMAKLENEIQAIELASTPSEHSYEQLSLGSGSENSIV